MKDAELIIGYVKDGKGVFTHDFCVGPVKHAERGAADIVLP